MSKYSNTQIEEMTKREKDKLIDIVRSVKYIWLFFKDSKDNDIKVQTDAESALGIITNTNGYQYEFLIENKAPDNFALLTII